MKIFFFDKDKKKNKKILKLSKKINYFNIKDLKKNSFDAGVIASPPSTHLMYAKLLFKKNIPFLVEKPLGNNLEGWNELINKVEKKNFICGVAYPRRVHPAIDTIKKKLSNGIIGKVKLINSNFSQDFRKYRPDYKKIYFSNQKSGGGLIIDGLIHHINLINYFFGKPKFVSCISDKVTIKNINVEDFARLDLIYKKDIYTSIFGNNFQKPYEDYLDIIGDKGTIKIERNNNKILFLYNDKRKIIQNVNFKWTHMLDLQICNFINCIKKKRIPPTSLRSGFVDLKIAIRARKISKKINFYKKLQ